MRTHRLLSLALVLVAPVLPAAAMADATQKGFPPAFVAQLATNKEIYVGTARKNGTRSEVVPVWFGFVDNAIWFTTGPDSHKARRIKTGSPVFVSVVGKEGPFITTKAEVIRDGAMADRLGEVYAQKYWIAWLGLFKPSRARNESGKTILLKLTPAE